MIVIDTRAVIAAERNAPTMVSLVASMVTAEPPASGATAVTCSTNSRRPLLPRTCGPGITCSRARPSGSSQSRDTSGGTDASVTGSALSAVRRWSS